MFTATVEYETKKGNLKTAQLPVQAKSLKQAEAQARSKVMNNGLRRVKRIRSVTVASVPVSGKPQLPKRGFFARLFWR